MACPICTRKADEKYRPFCSKRCADIDLGKWMSGSYSVPSEREEDQDEALAELERASRIEH